MSSWHDSVSSSPSPKPWKQERSCPQDKVLVIAQGGSSNRSTRFFCMCLRDECRVDPMHYLLIHVPTNPQQQWTTVLTFSGSDWDRLGRSWPKQQPSYPEKPDIMANLWLTERYVWVKVTQVSTALTFERTLAAEQATRHRDLICSSQSQPNLAGDLSRSQTFAL